MARKRYVVELGMGADLHGGNVTKAAQRAIQDAISRSCLCGLFDIIGIDNPDQLHVVVKIACPEPDAIDQAVLRKTVPFGSVDLKVVDGGLSVRGLNLPALGAGDTIVVANAALTVYVDVNETG